MFTIGKIAGFLASLGVGTIVGHAIKATTPTKLGAFKKILVWVGGLALMGIIGDKASNYIEEQVDGGIKIVKDLKNPPVVEEIV